MKCAIGPAIKDGFYYDFDVEKPFTPEDLEKIEAEMKKIVKQGIPLERFELPPAEALELMKDDPYKVELIEEHSGKGEAISFFKQGDFTDLCAGPHLPDTSRIKAFKLTSTTGGLTGEVTPVSRCFAGSMVLLFQKLPCWKRTWLQSKRQSAVITANWAKN